MLLCEQALVNVNVLIGFIIAVDDLAGVISLCLFILSAVTKVGHLFVNTQISTAAFVRERCLLNYFR